MSSANGFSAPADYSNLRALFINCTLKRSPEPSHTQGLVDLSTGIMAAHGVAVETVRAVDYDIATGVWPDMTRTRLGQRRLAADLRQGPGCGHSRARRTDLVGRQQFADEASASSDFTAAHTCSTTPASTLYYGRVGGCLITGNEDGVKHCAQNILYSLQHIGYTIPPQADAGWIGEAGPGPSYLDPARAARRTTSPTATPRS